MNKILVPTDFSPTAENAANYAGNLCKELGAKLVLLHVYMLPVPVSEIPYVMVSADDMQKASETALKKEANRVFELLGIEVEWVVRLGLASDEIRDVEKERKINLIIMGMNGGGEFDKLIGSTTIAVIRKCLQPVLVVPEHVRYAALKSIAYATDFSYTLHPSCFAPLQLLIATYKSRLDIVNVQKIGKTSPEDHTAGKARLDQVLQVTGPNYIVIEDNNIEHGLQQFIQMNNPDMLAMVAHKHNLMDRLFGVHHTKEMIYHTHIPILILQDKN